YEHAARNCMSEKRTTYEQQNQINKPQFIKRRNINMVEIENDDDDYWEDEIYITQLPRASPYSTNCKEQKKSKEMNLHNRTITTPQNPNPEPEPIEIDTPIKITKPTKQTPVKR
ncbi:26735_t:CDS:2, partial [Gigaspora margarita]